MANADPIAATGAAFSDSTATPLSNDQSFSAAMAAYNGNAQLQAYVAQEYGDNAWMMSIPELQQILIATAYYGWDQSRVDSALNATQWWKQNGQAAAEWQQLQATDPNSALRQVGQAAATIRASANSLGVQLSDSQINSLGAQSAEFSWNSATINQAIAAMYKSTTTNPTGGTAASFKDQATAMLQQYAVPVSQTTLDDWTNRAVQGSADISGFEAYLRQQATTLYPFMAKSLAQGVTPQSFFSPYSSAASSLLGVSEGSINWSDPKWLSAVTQQNPGGEQTPVNLTQFQQTLRTDPQFAWSGTADAKAAAYTTAKQIASTFGKVA